MPPQDNLPDHSTAAQDAQAKTRRLLADMQALSSRTAAVQEIVTAINQSLELDEILDIVGHQAKWLPQSRVGRWFERRAAESSTHQHVEPLDARRGGWVDHSDQPDVVGVRERTVIRGERDPDLELPG